MKQKTNKLNIVLQARILKSLFVILFLSAFTLISKASHLIGGNITYTHVSGSTYNIKLALYRDCDGVGLGTVASVNVAAPGFSTNVSLTQTAVAERTILCPGQSSTCTNSSSSVDGVQEHLYSGNVTLPANDSYQITYDVCCRPSGVTNLVSPSGQALFLSSLLVHNSILNNNSPAFLNPAIGKFCNGQTATLSLNAFDADGDVLVYSLVGPRGAGGAPIAYVGGLSATNPMVGSSASINSATGQITFTPSTSGQRAVFGIRVEEFRGGNKIGEIYRDLEVTSINCASNIAPIIAAIANQNTNVGQQICVPITATDANGDIVALSAISGILPPGTFIVNSSVAGTTMATFCFTPSAVHAGQTFAVTINATDNSCPDPGTASQTFNITVPGTAGVPTMSEWSLIILSLISLSIGMVFILRKKQNAIA